MANYISLEEAKQHLRIDFSDDDRYVQSLCDVCEIAIENEIGITLDNLVLSGSLSDIPTPVRHAAKLMVGTLYENREPVTGLNIKEVPFSMTYLLHPYKYYSIQ